MLKSYDYSERDIAINNEIVALTKEKNAARMFLAKHAEEVQAIGRPCPACGGKGLLFKKPLGVSYLKCSECGSIYADCTEELLEKYRLETITKNAVPSDYTHDSEEFRFWLNFRALRHLGETYNPEKVVLYLDKLRGVYNPVSLFEKLRKQIPKDGMLVFSLRLGSGFETLTNGFNEHNGRIFPLKYIFLPTESGLRIALEKAGFHLLELSSVGTADVLYGKGEKQDSLFLDYLINDASDAVRNDFQRFLQSNGLSSYARGIAR